MKNTELNSKQIEQALGILKREQQADMPTSRELFCFGLLKIGIIVFTLVSIPRFFMDIAIDHFPGMFLDIQWFNPIIINTFFNSAFIVLTILVAFLFSLNLRLVQRLCRQAILRRKLGLNRLLQHNFAVQRTSGWTFSILLKVFICIVTIFIIYAVTFNLRLVLSSSGFTNVLAMLNILSRIVAPLLLLFSLIALYFIMRGKERLEVVNRLSLSLSNLKKSLQGTPDQSNIKMPSVDYDMIARMERGHIMRDRHLSIQRAHKEKYTDSYAILKSHTVRNALAQIDHETRVQVEDQILNLISDPVPPTAQFVPDTAFIKWDIPGTDFSISYQVEDDQFRIKIFSLEQIDSNNSNIQPEDQ